MEILRGLRGSRHPPGESGVDVVMAAGKGFGHKLISAVEKDIVSLKPVRSGNGIEKRDRSAAARLDGQVSLPKLQRFPVNESRIAQIDGHL